MAKITELETCKALLSETWLSAYDEMAIAFLGKNAKIFLQQAYIRAAENWIKVMDEKYSLKINRNCKTLKEAVESYINLGVDGGLFKDRSDFVLEEIDDKCTLKISVKKCPYVDACSFLLKERNFGEKNIACPRIGCFRGAVEFLLGKKCGYKIMKVSPNEGCEGVVYNTTGDCKDKILKYFK